MVGELVDIARGHTVPPLLAGVREAGWDLALAVYAASSLSVAAVLCHSTVRLLPRDLRRQQVRHTADQDKGSGALSQGRRRGERSVTVRPDGNNGTAAVPGKPDSMP